MRSRYTIFVVQICTKRQVSYELCPQEGQVQCTCSADLRTKPERSRALILRSLMNSAPRGSGYTVPAVQICAQRRKGPGPWSSGPLWTLTPGGAGTQYLQCRFAHKDGEIQGLDPQVPCEPCPRGSGYTVPAVQICAQRRRGPGPWSSGPLWTLPPGGVGTVYLQCRFAYKDGEIQGLDPQVPYELCPQGEWVLCVPVVKICLQRQRGPEPWSSGPVWTLTPGGAGTLYLQCRFAYKDGEVQGLDPQVPCEPCPRGSGYSVPAVQICVQIRRGPGPWSSGPEWTLIPGAAGWPGWFRHPVQPLPLPPPHQPEKSVDQNFRKQCCGTVTIFYGYRFRLLKSYGSCSDFRQATVPVLTFDKLRFLFRLHI